MKNSDWPILHMTDRQFIQSPSTFFGFAIPNVCYRLLSTWTTYGSVDLSSSSTRWKSRPQFVCPMAVNHMASETNFTQVEWKEIGNRIIANKLAPTLDFLNFIALFGCLSFSTENGLGMPLSYPDCLLAANLLRPSLTDKQHQRSHYHSSNIHQPTVTLINCLQASLAR